MIANDTGRLGPHSAAPIAPLAAVLLLVALACGPRQDAAVEQETVENRALTLRLIDLESPWTLTGGEADRWVFADGSGGTLTIDNGPEIDNPNIIEAVRGKLDEFEDMEGGESFGSQQFQAPIGLVYTARGRYADPRDAAAALGEITGYTVHPAGGRFLVLSYTYPGDADPAERYGHLLNLLGSLERLDEQPG